MKNGLSLALIGMFMLLATPARAAEGSAALPSAQVKMSDLVRDVQRTDVSSDVFDLVWWMPKEYMEVSMAQSQAADPDLAREFIALFDKYTVVAAVRGKIGALGMESYESEGTLRGLLRIQDASGKTYAPIPENKVDNKMALVISALRPMFKQMVGELGENIQVFVFEGKLANGARIADPLATGQFVVKMGDNARRFRLPLGSLLVSREDAATGESFPGSFNFNPYTGAALQPTAP